MNNKIVKITFVDNSNISFSVNKNTTYNIPSSGIYNLENWLNSEASSIMVTTESGCKVGLNKYNVKYAEILID